MNTIDENLSREEVEYIFNKFDDNKDCSISFEEFKKWLQDFGVRFSCKLEEQTFKNNKCSIL
jgi:Ca2+-binding EF-hand superfamily protein